MLIGCYKLGFSDRPEYYFGSSVNIQGRFRYHLSELRRGTHVNIGLQNAWNLSESKELTLSYTETEDEESARWLEEETIKRYFNDPSLVNIGLGGFNSDNLTRHPKRQEILEHQAQKTREYCANMPEPARQALRKRMSGENNPMYGRTHSEEARKKMSETNLGNTYNLGKTLSPEHVLKISERAKKRIGPLNPMYGKNHTPEYKKWASESRLGKKPTNCNKIEIDGIIYESQADTAKALNTCCATITYRLSSKNPKYSGYKIIKQEEN
jgi:group I intron endonuclease